MQHNINPYNEKDFQSKFSESKLYAKLKNDFDVIFFSPLEEYRFPTPRFGLGSSAFSATPFYYLNYLIKYNPEKIYDLGCGWNIFKKYIPNLIGVGAELPDSDNYYGDVHDFVDEAFVRGHQNYFDSVFSINALHFRPLRELRQTILEFASMIAPRGRGFLALNIQRMIELDSSEYNDYEYYVRSELSNMNFTYEVFDVNLSTMDSWMDGNIRMVIYKHE
jgi:hypothetical protein